MIYFQFSLPKVVGKPKLLDNSLFILLPGLWKSPNFKIIHFLFFLPKIVGKPKHLYDSLSIVFPKVVGNPKLLNNSLFFFSA